MNFTDESKNLKKEEMLNMNEQKFLYESRTEYDFDGEKKLDVKIGTAHKVVIEKTSEEKLQVLLASDKMNLLGKQVKVKIEEFKNTMDVKLKRSHDLSDMQAGEELYVFVKIPEALTAEIELSGTIGKLFIRNVSFDTLEFSGKVKEGFLSDCSGHVELDTSSDVDFTAEGFKGKVDFNQIHASSVLKVKSGNCSLRRIGASNSFLNEKGEIIDLAKSLPFQDYPEEEISGFDFIAEIAGRKSTLQIVRADSEKKAE